MEEHFLGIVRGLVSLPLGLLVCVGRAASNTRASSLFLVTLQSGVQLLSQSLRSLVVAIVIRRLAALRSLVSMGGCSLRASMAAVASTSREEMRTVQRRAAKTREDTERECVSV